MEKRPNILFVMTDHTHALALAPGSECLTPNLDALAAEGMQFGRCYTTNAICSPARASLMTALYPSSHGMWDCTHTQRAEWVDVPAARFTYFSQILKDEGYRNAYFGKWHVEQSNKLEDFGWHEYERTSAGMPRTPIPGSEVLVPKAGYPDYLLAAVGESNETPRHPAFDQGIEFIRRHTAGQATGTADPQPFCCFVSSSEPHDPYIPPKPFFDMYDPAALTLSPTLHDEPTGKPEVVRRLRSVWQGVSDDEWRRVTAAYWATITFLDSEVGRLIDTLKETGQYENTVIVFTSDHGDMMGGHGLVTKGIGTAYEEVYNIPLIVRAPGMATGVHNTETLTSLVDLAPTLLDLCNAPALEQAQGHSLRDVLENRPGAAPRADAYAEFFGQRFVYTQRLVWHDSWKYVFNPGGIDELYNLATDPHERQNMAESPEHRKVLENMAARMWQKMKDIGDVSLFNTNYATLRTAPVGPGILEDAS